LARGLLGLPLADDQRRILDDVVLVVDQAGHLLQYLEVGTPPCLGEDLLRAPAEFRREHGEQVLVLDRRIPDVEVTHLGVLAHASAIRAHRRVARCPVQLAVKAEDAARDHDARHQPLQVPFPRSGKGLVEVVDSEDEISLRRGEDAEVGQVHVAARLHREAGDGDPGPAPSPPLPRAEKRRGEVSIRA
jgi:hypothetical protein